MNVIPQFKVIGPYNYHRIIHKIEKSNAKRLVEVTVKWRDAFNLKLYVIGQSKHFQTL